MTRKDYELIAHSLMMRMQEETHALAAVKGNEAHLENYVDGFASAVDAVVLALKSDNPKFNPATFLRACGVKR